MSQSPTSTLDASGRQEVRLVRLEEQVKALAGDVGELKEELRAFRRAILAELRAHAKAKEARMQLWLALLQPKTLIPLCIIVVSVLAAGSGMAFTWGDFEIGSKSEQESP
jgi:hypothetical protein